MVLFREGQNDARFLVQKSALQFNSWHAKTDGLSDSFITMLRPAAVFLPIHSRQTHMPIWIARTYMMIIQSLATHSLFQIALLQHFTSLNANTSLQFCSSRKTWSRQYHFGSKKVFTKLSCSFLNSLAGASADLVGTENKFRNELCLRQMFDLIEKPMLCKSSGVGCNQPFLIKTFSICLIETAESQLL